MVSVTDIITHHCGNRLQLYIFMKYYSDPKLDFYITNYRRSMLVVVISTLVLLIGMCIFVVFFDNDQSVSIMGFYISEYVLFGMQVLLVVASIFFYIRLTLSFISAQGNPAGSSSIASVSVREELLSTVEEDV